jgi:hypothetical protein
LKSKRNSCSTTQIVSRDTLSNRFRLTLVSISSQTLRGYYF